MEDIKDVVHSIVRGCEQTGVEVPEVLAAFVARTIIETNASTFSLDRKVTPELLDQVILQSIEKLLEADNPALETMKMQVDYDSSFLTEDSQARKAIHMRYKLLANHKASVVDVEMMDANDFEALTTCYRKIFKFLLDFAPNISNSVASHKGGSHGATVHDRAVEREVAAALESVFPRIGLKAFVQLNSDEKNVQLAELGRIVLGIRLYNRDQGRGGAGLEENDKESMHLATSMLQDIDREVEFFADACNKYQTAIVRANLRNRRMDIEAENLTKAGSGFKHEDEEKGDRKSLVAAHKDFISGGKVILEKKPVSPYLIERWVKELSNRRQYLTFLRTLQDEIHMSHQKMAQFCDSVSTELIHIKTLISNKSSVAKEVIYPRFDSLGNIWVQLYEEALILRARSNTFRTLCKYRSSFNHALSEEYYIDSATAADMLEKDMALVFGTTKTKKHSMSAEAKSGGHTGTSKEVESKEIAVGKETEALAESDPKMNDASDVHADSKAPEETLAAALNHSTSHSDMLSMEAAKAEYNTGAVATLLSVHNTPDFMLLPLELQGYCPWTLVNAKGLLIPGKPALGVIRYENAYYVCDHEVAIRDFMRYPEYFLKQIRDRVMANPEFIHLLRIQQWFPSASIAKLLESPDFDPTTGGGGHSAKVDASTSTPTHFVDKYIDVNYHWNEWELRKRALKIVNLKNCTTVSAQTDASHMRRDNETQVYESRIKGTQTKRDNFTNPPIKTQYITGLRGTLPPEQTEAVTKYLTKDYLKNNESKQSKPDQYGNKPRIVSLTLDL